MIMSLLGLLAVPKVSVRFNESNSLHNLVISYRWPNAAPEALERQVTAPLEGIMGTLQGIKNITSVSDYNKGAITLELDEKTDLDRTRFDVSSLVRQVYRSLPEGLGYPVISVDNPEGDGNRPLLSLQVNGNDAPGKLRKYIEGSLKPRLARLDGVRSVEVHGGELNEWVLEYKPAVIASLGITEEEINKAISEQNLQSHLGWVNEANGIRQSISLAPESRILDFKSIHISKKKDRVINLSSIVTLSKREKPSESYFRINGKSAVQVVLTPLAGINQLTTVAAVRKSLETIRRELPPGYGIRIDYDSTDHIYENLNRMKWLAGAALLLIVILTSTIFRSWKVLCLVLSGLITNILLAALIFFVFKLTIRLPSIVTLILSIGLISGNILITYYYYYKRRDRIITISFLGSTLIMAAALSVTWLLPIEMRADLNDFAITLIVVQGVSFCVCLWLIPALMEQLQMSTPLVSFQGFGSKVKSVYYTVLKLVYRHRRLAIISGVLLFGLPLFLLPPRMENETRFAKTYNDFFGNEWYSENVRPYLDKGLGGFLRIFSNYVENMSSYSSNEQTALYIHAGLPNQSTVEQMDAVLRQVESELGQFEEIDRFITQVYNGQMGRIVVYFKKPHDQGNFPYTMKAKAIFLSTKMSGIDWNIYGVGQGFNLNVNENSALTFNVVLKGYNYKELEAIAFELGERLMIHPRIQDVDVNKVPGLHRQKDLFAYKMKSDDVYWSRYGVSKYDLFVAMEKYNARPYPDLYELIDDSYVAIKIQPVGNTSFDINALQSEPLPILDSIRLKTGKYASLFKEKIIPSIRKENQHYLRQVTFEYIGSARFGEKFLDKTLNEYQLELPMGYTVEKKALGWWQLAARQQYELIALALVLIFIISSIMFESLRQPFTLITSITLSFIGLFIAFYICEAEFDQGGYGSFLFVTGVVSLPIIMMINEYNSQLRIGSFMPLEVYLHAVSFTAKPIIYFLVFTLSTLIPFAWYGPEQPFWYALAIGSGGGIIASLFVTFFFIPVLLLSSKYIKLRL